MRFLIFLLIFLSLLSFARADVVLEQDFEAQANCTTGREDLCFTDNGFQSGDPANFRYGKIKHDGSIQGDGYLEIQMPFGAASTGRISVAIPGTPTEARWGMFVKFSTDYIFYTETHGPGIRLLGNDGCDVGGNWEPGITPKYYMAQNGNCGFGGGQINMGINQSGASYLAGGRWYWIEQYIKVDTSCTTPTSATGCNGEYRMWIDGTLWAEHTNRNFGGVNKTALVSTFAYEWYYHIGWPGHSGTTPRAQIDNLIVRDDNTLIGNPGGTQGTANAYPYFAWTMANNHVSRQFPDCTSPGWTGRHQNNYGDTWGDEANITQANGSSPAGANTYPPDATACSTQAAIEDVYFKSATTGAGRAGHVFDRVYYENGTGTDQYHTNWFIHGKMYLDSSNDYTTNPILSSFRAYNCYSGCCDGSCAPWARLIGVTVDEVSGTDRYAIGYRWDTATTTIVATSTETITEDAWVEYQLWHDYANETVTLYIDATDDDVSNGSKVIDAFDMSAYNHNFMQPPGGDGGGGAVYGITTTAVATKAYQDDVSVGTQSFNSCDGWIEGTCPFEFNEPTCESGNAYYVAKTGNDSNPGTLASPWLTIQKAANTLTAGEKVCVRAGTYEEPNFISPDAAYGGIKPQNSGTEGFPIIYEGYPGEAVIIDQNGTTTEAAGFYIKNKDYITIKGFEITDCWKAGVFVDYSDADGNSGIVVERNTIHNIQDDPGNNLAAIKLNDTINGVARNNRIYNVFTSSKREAGVHSFDGINMLVENNEISDVEIAVFQKRSAGITDKGATIRRNIIYDADIGIQHGVSAGGDPGHLGVEVYGNLIYDVNAGFQSSLASAGSQSDEVYIYNNTIIPNAGSEPRCIGIQYWDNVNIHSNICVSTSISHFDTKYSGCDRPVSYTELDYNVYFTVQKFLIRFSCVAEQDEYTTLASFKAAENLDLNSIYDDPEFNDAGTDDYTLEVTSPALTAAKDGGEAGAYGYPGTLGIEASSSSSSSSSSGSSSSSSGGTPGAAAGHFGAYY